MIASYLAVERDLGRIAADADVVTLAPTLLGASHLLFADRTGTAPEPEAVRKLVTAVIQEEDSEPLLSAVLEAGFHATKVASTGGFLHRKLIHRAKEKALCDLCWRA